MSNPDVKKPSESLRGLGSGNENSTQLGGVYLSFSGVKHIRGVCV